MLNPTDVPFDGSSKNKLKDLKTRRSSIKGQITKFKNYLTELSTLSELSNIEIAELSLKLSKFEGLSIKFDELQNDIELFNVDNIEVEIDERYKIEHDIIVNIATAKTLLDKFNKIESEQRRESIAVEAQCSLDHHDYGFKLPQIQIAKFEGSYFHWLQFRDTFESLIHNNSRIKPIHKFHYLISYLEGEPARIISNLEVSSVNYTEAWRLLGERYNNKRLLINHHLNALFNTQTLNRETERSLRFLVDHVTKNLRALSSLGQPTDKWDIIIIFMLSSKLDSTTLLKWEEYRNTLVDVPNLDQFYKFLIDRADVIEALNRNKQNEQSKSILSKPGASSSHIKYNNMPSTSNNRSFKHSFTKSFTSTYPSHSKDYVCVICNDNHKIYDCNVFKAKSIREKLADVAMYKLCLNCLRQGHSVNKCHMGPCRECKKRHNTLLHSKESKDDLIITKSASIVNYSSQDFNQVLLSTALIEVSNPETGQRQKTRAMLDCGSQSSFITHTLKEKLGLKSNRIDTLKVIGIGNNCSNHVIECCDIQLNSLTSDFKVKQSCLVLKELTGNIPMSKVNIFALNIPKDILLADPNFYQPSPIDMIIGADLFWEILESQQISLAPNGPKLQKSKLGWMVTGPLNKGLIQNNVQCNQASVVQNNQNSIENLLTKFWDLEEIPKGRLLTEQEKACERHFYSNMSRLPTGRFMVRLPLSDDPKCLGDSYNLAKRRFLNLERKFKRNLSLKLQYSKFIQEYADLGHLSESSIAKPTLSYFLCHHAVFKENSESTSIRVVFDGSASSSSGVSLNQILMVGPNVQDSLFSILIRARQYRYILSADIEKMYRQVQVHPDDRKLQLILWREDESQPIKTLQLNTLTYGTASASYLSTKCLSLLGDEQNDELIKDIIKHDFYVDDLITGCNSVTQMRYIQKSVSEALKKGCFNLRKYKTNLATLFQNSNLNTQENLTISESSNTLGLGWNPADDCLHFQVKDADLNNNITKRSIMSNSLKIFDPLGLLSPCIIQTKMILQNLWEQKVDWDQDVPQDIKTKWIKFQQNLPYILNLKISRHVQCNSAKYVEMHSFSDASLSGYGACIYMRSTDGNGHFTVRLLCAKSKVAPLKATTIPRLELCAALLASRLCQSVTDSLRLKPDRIVHWCDSKVVLAWIANDIKDLKVFVANRVSEIRELTNSSSWRYVPTSCNPADLISRGVDASQLVSMNLWWLGPDYLSKNESEWPVSKIDIENNKLPEIKSHTISLNSEPIIHFKKYSKFSRLQRSFAYLKRFIFNLKNPKDKRLGCLSNDELLEAFHYLCALAQAESFPTEYELLTKNKELSPKSKILSLSPFIDQQNKIIRVGGRINQSNYNYDKKHPILLHASHHLTKLIFEKEHLKHLHAGPQLLLAVVRETVWPVNGRHLARRTVNNCVCCRRMRGKTLNPKMGDLPTQRITPDLPFSTVGLDYAGPFLILSRKGRGSKLIKCYLCLFVCLRYKCVHLEAVSDLTKDAFIMTFRRFIARRGKPVEVFCDNGRNFVAAAKEIGDFLKQNEDHLSNFINQEGINFKFSPSYAPHFGGIFEAGIKSAKFHIKRVMGNSHLTYEEIGTLFSQVEAILNSRPLYPLSSSPNDLLPLTPGHFLIGRPLTALPSPALENHNESNLRRYARIEKLHQDFWKRWKREYISELQQRTKWRVNYAKLNVGDLVLLHEDHTPPLNWRLGRVKQLYPGQDGISRVADIETAGGSVRRPFTRLCPLA